MTPEELEIQDLEEQANQSYLEKKLQKTKFYNDNMGHVMFFHFNSFEEPPEIICDGSNGDDFDTVYWTHFCRFDFNEIIQQAINQQELED